MRQFFNTLLAQPNLIIILKDYFYHLLIYIGAISWVIYSSTSWCKPKNYLKGNLRIHKKSIHEGGRPRLKCHKCNKVYLSQPGLETHIKRVHEGQKMTRNHVCNWCGKAFQSRQNLRRHVEDIHLTPSTTPSKKLKSIINPY